MLVPKGRTSAAAAWIFAVLTAAGAPLQATDDLTDALAAGRFADAVRAADARLKAQPRDTRALIVRGIALERLGDLRESLASFERALAIEPSSPAALEGAAEVAYRSRSPKAAALVDRVLAVEPASETAHGMAGVLAVEAGRCERAVSHFERSGAALAANRTAATQYGGCLLRVQRAADAAAVFERLAREQPADVAALYNLAVARLEAGQAEAAVAAAKTALGLAPRDPDVLSVFASASVATGAIAPAIAALRTATEVAPDQDRHYLDLAGVCLDHDAADLALEVVNAGLAHVPSSARLYTMRGAIRADRGELDQAMRDFEQARRLSPDALYGSVGLSMVLRQSDRLPEAIATLREKLKVRPRNATLNYLLADALLRNDPDPATPEAREAKAALRRAIAASPGLARAHGALGKLLLKSGETAAAIREFSEAATLEPNDRLALNQLVMAYRQAGRQKDAEAAAARLKALLDRERREEVERNRVRLVRGEAASTPAARP
jgi:superkiller protein 3